MFDPNMTALGSARQQDLLHQAERDRLIREVKLVAKRHQTRQGLGLRLRSIAGRLFSGTPATPPLAASTPAEADPPIAA